MDPTLEQRLIRFLDREDIGQQRSEDDLRALTIDERVLEGECIRGARLVRFGADGFEFAVTENLSKFRAGDLLAIGDGVDLSKTVPGVHDGYDAATGILRVARDRGRGGLLRLEAGVDYCVDRRSFGSSGRLHDTVRAAFADERLAALLHGEVRPAFDAARTERARAALLARGLGPSQVEAGASVVGAESLCLVQGPPGTGKTRLLAEVVVLLARAGCRIALSAFTHKAVDNALAAIRALDATLPLVKLGTAGRADAELEAIGVRFVQPRRADLPRAGVVVAGTCYAFAKLDDGERFHLTVVDEAGQMPIPHALVAMRLASRVALFGDHRQLPPVVTERHDDEAAARSIFEHLHELYGSHLLDVTYRMNDPICATISELFYGGRLHPEPSVGARRAPFVPGGRFDWWLDPERPLAMALVDHVQSGPRSPQEATFVADLVDEAVRRHDIDPAQICVVAPFRAQVRAIRDALTKRGLGAADGLTVDTVERIQGQQREMVVLSMAMGDAEALRNRAAFFFSPQRLNVALSRARTKAVVVASPRIFRALPLDPAALRAAALFRRLERLVPKLAAATVASRERAVTPRVHRAARKA